MKKDQVDLVNAVVWIPDSKTPNGIAEIPLPLLATQAFQHQLAMSGADRSCFRATRTPPVTRRLSRPSGAKLFGVPEFPTSGSMTYARHMQHD